MFQKDQSDLGVQCLHTPAHLSYWLFYGTAIHIEVLLYCKKINTYLIKLHKARKKEERIISLYFWMLLHEKNLSWYSHFNIYFAFNYRHIENCEVDEWVTIIIWIITALKSDWSRFYSESRRQNFRFLQSLKFSIIFIK